MIWIYFMKFVNGIYCSQSIRSSCTLKGVSMFMPIKDNYTLFSCLIKLIHLSIHYQSHLSGMVRGVSRKQCPITRAITSALWSHCESGMCVCVCVYVQRGIGELKCFLSHHAPIRLPSFFFAINSCFLSQQLLGVNTSCLFD